MGLVRAMAILQGASGIAKDRYVNNFTFDMVDDAVTEDVADHIGAALDAFYALIDPFIPNTIAREDYRLYDLEEVKPREPTFVVPTTQPSAAGPAYPYEVAAVLSFYGTRNLPRQRGRVFLGPLAITAGGPGEINQDPQITPAFRAAALDAAEALYNGIRFPVDGSDGRWCVLSSVSGQRTIIENCWVDNEFDTIRKRGSEASLRATRDLNATSP